ncbi:unnamed protein product [Chilo suppressalis]|uniref:Ribokinase n=1 Tax=Chilo suppressalis TaxID=168631 RepID=A0ABN8L6D6_CHISP|nr:unnamed protein product [Chilo suppressalis]
MTSNKIDYIPKIVVCGSCSVDFTTYAPRLPNHGETLHGTKFVTSFGGKGANQCIAAARLGGNTYMISRVGDDQWGQKYKDNLKTAGVDVTHVYNTHNVTTGIAQITVAESGQNQIVIVLGANGHLSKTDVEKSKELIITADVLIGQLETPFETTLEAFKINRGLKLLNAAPGRNDIQEILPYCSILCVNESEASILANHPVVSVKTAVEAIKKILALGCATVIVTLGENGALYASKNDPPTHVFCDKVVPVDTTGAGDAFVGALATYLVSHKDYPLHQIIGAACEVATISVTKEGTQTSYPTNYTPFTKEYKYETL